MSYTRQAGDVSGKTSSFGPFTEPVSTLLPQQGGRTHCSDQQPEYSPLMHQIATQIFVLDEQRAGLLLTNLVFKRMTFGVYTHLDSQVHFSCIAAQIDCMAV